MEGVILGRCLRGLTVRSLVFVFAWGLAWCLAWLTVGRAAAQPVRAPVPSGLYEGYSPVTRAPYGPIDAAATRTLRLPQWLEVTSQGESSEIVFLPERRVAWRLVYGPAGLLRKTVTVDGQPWTESRFGYRDGALRDKVVSGPGIGSGPGAASGTEAGRRYTYVLDEAGRIKERRGPISRSPFHGSDPAADRVTFSSQADGTTVDYTIGGQVVRRDRFDRAGRLVRTEVGRPATEAASRLSLIYVRDGAGRLQRILRQWFTAAPRPAHADRRAADGAGVQPAHLEALPPVVERHEVLLLLGQPERHSRDVAATERSVRDQYGKTCWLNRISELTYDAAGMLSRYGQTCICGLCVAAPSAPRPLSGADLLGRDEHWLSGPWLRLDERVDVTADHRVLTPAGPRPAGALRPGDVVLGEDGAPRRLSSVRTLPRGPERRGVNLRTRSGRFAAGGLLFESETPQPCPRPDEAGGLRQ